jgi:D-glycero-D-manno-heptose 1,7-bisphosphate phosphatase
VRRAEDKILPRDEVARICESHRAAGRRVGFTSGAFDLVHAGHADFLERARMECDVLVVGINTDESVRQYKGPDRPIVPENERAMVVAAFESVDCVFLFSERRHARNIELLRPDLYIKAGDYKQSALTSSDLVEQYGGKSLILEIRRNTSTTKILERLAAPTTASPQSPEQDAVCLDTRPAKTAPAVFVDRDGTINREVEYLHDPAAFELLPGAGEGLRRFRDMGYRVVVVTTQAGIGLGYFTKEDFYRVNQAMFRALRPFDIAIDRIYYCPHGKGDGCKCRKPDTGLIERAQKDLNIDLAHSFVIGDKTSDLETARRTGMRSILVRTGHAGGDGEYAATPDYTANDLADAAEWVLRNERGD